jgi:hypothetical protein
MQLRASPVPSNGCRLLISNINQGTEFLSKERQQQANSAMVMASLKTKENIERPQKSRQTEKGRKTGKRNPKKKPKQREETSMTLGRSLEDMDLAETSFM